ncbi:MAG: translation initiation factor IF-3 [Patescibacteria group bacterium]
MRFFTWVRVPPSPHPFILHITPISRRFHRHHRPKQETIKHLRRNDSITVPEIFLIGENNEALGVMPTQEALARAVQAESDLVEVSPKAQPPVCRIIEYGKFIYKQEKADRKQKAKQKKIELKGIRLTLKMGDHDRQIRQNQALKFLEKGDKVKIELILRGREKAHSDLAQTQIRDFMATLRDQVVVEQDIKREVGRYTAIIAPLSKS